MSDGAQARSAIMTNAGTVIYWAFVLLALFGTLSMVMSLALFEGSERYQGAGGWAAFAFASYVIGWIIRRALSR